MNRLGTLVFAGVAVVAGAYWLTLPSQGNLPANPFIGGAEAQQAEIDTSTIVEMVQGAEDAPVEIIEYASYTCPHCAAFHQGPYKQLKADFIDTGKVRFVYREVYFDRYGLWASMVARCAGPEKFFGISDLIYKGQAEWSRAGGPAEIAEELRKIGRLAGIENDKLEACLGDATMAQTLVAWYQEHATRDEINSTPSFMINGKKVENQAYEGFKALIEAELGS
ncbi:DsbA family protein [Ruegeria pomeroyi]|uniref:DsbA family protein n=1 Tax=Ruegeria alba TaxID=2916756 RepID=A0ABS9NV72_9RHOB|nr:DsbA family protein [Ruegeria alba]MCE8512607.1 DsbA family protein [Ruegeria pomeroyi]MCE8517452.1 DsbA family protein [Ruegeria pomeroyi]MCE8521735.1 DsbA family protein [Ruegeria pomeroyi]MCE8525388.1 DsbA family protein [Ruegeria pomeroyi]MCE8533700.1 DsbA family protein [Ruegeria pomeroyi]